MRTLFISVMGRMSWGGDNSYFNFRPIMDEDELCQVVYNRETGDPMRGFEVPLTETVDSNQKVPHLRYGDVIMVQDLVNSRIYVFEYLGFKKFTKVKLGINS